MLDYLIGSLLHSNNISLLINQGIQIYCFVYGILCLLTAIFQSTNFIYADSLLKMKPVGWLLFIAFWYCKLWSVFDEWMVWLNCLVGLYIAVYFYDSVCNITSPLIYRRDASRIGSLMGIVWLLIGGIIWVIVRRGYVMESVEPPR
jgi:hypothetical protein